MAELYKKLRSLWSHLMSKTVTHMKNAFRALLRTTFKMKVEET
jgi:hypothetical protein